MDFWQGFLLVTGIHLLAAMSPGPDFIFVSQQTLSRGRLAGLVCALGVALGLGVHIVYSVLGLAVIIAQASWLLILIKIVGGAYLVWLGIQGLRARARGEVIELQAGRAASEGMGRTLWRGCLCNVLNPKAPVYFVSVFTVVLSPAMPPWQLVAYGLWMMLLQFAWFAAVAFLLSIPSVNRKFQRAGHWVDRVLGGVMVALGIKVVSS
ncbi:MAG: LysE family transporter [Lautropia sp.]|nr:LysE family transporter [Lautropia sp.]